MRTGIKQSVFRTRGPQRVARGRLVVEFEQEKPTRSLGAWVAEEEAGEAEEDNDEGKEEGTYSPSPRSETYVQSCLS